MFHGCCFSIARAVQFGINPFQHRIQIVRNLRIPESDDSVSLLFKPKLSLTIALSGFVVVMMSAVEFDNKMCSRTKEVHHIGANWRLALEVCAEHGKFLQCAP